MAEHTPSGPAELGAPMDYGQHERTYGQFVTLTKLTILGTFATLIALVLFAFGGGAGFWLGILMVLLTTIGFTIGLVSNGTAKPLAVVTVIGVLLVAISVG